MFERKGGALVLMAEQMQSQSPKDTNLEPEDIVSDFPGQNPAAARIQPSTEHSADISPRVPDDMSSFKDVFDDTLFFINELVAGYDYYPEICDMIAEGEAEASVRVRYMLKAIDEKWVNAVEDSLVAIDKLIRAPSRFIEETEKVLPIEISRNITSRSIRDLALHTDYIEKIEGDMITPSKILNVFRDETLFTYENKFLNTLINKLYLFVNKRYETAKKHGQDEKLTSLNFKSDFTNGGMKGKFSFGLEISESPEANLKIKNHTFSGSLWKRVEELNSVVTSYLLSVFCKSMGQSFVRPPILRTNAITKNPELRQCLALYEFIESYENVGYDLLIEETAKAPDEEHVRALHSMLAIQYLIFRAKLKGDADEVRDEETVSSRTAKPLSPKFDTEFSPYKADDYNVYDTRYHKVVPVSRLSDKKKLSKSELDIRQALDIAFAAESILEKQRIQREEAERKAREEEERRREAELAEAAAREKAEREAAIALENKIREEEAAEAARVAAIAAKEAKQREEALARAREIKRQKEEERRRIQELRRTRSPAYAKAAQRHAEAESKKETRSHVAKATRNMGRKKKKMVKKEMLLKTDKDD